MTSPGPDPTEPAFPPPVDLGKSRPVDPAAYGGPPPDYGHPPAYGGPPPAYGGPPPAYGGPPPAYGYGYPPPGAYPGGGYPPGYPPPGPGGWGAPPPPPGVVFVTGGPPLRAAAPGQRALARLIDSVGYLVVIAAGVVAIIAVFAHSLHRYDSYDFSYGYPTAHRGAGLEFLWIYPIAAGVWLIIVAYESLMIGLTGSTVGGRLMGVAFVNARTGARPGLGRALGRAAFLGVSVAVCDGLVFLLLLFSMFFDSGTGRYQGWVDKICGLQAITTKG